MNRVLRYDFSLLIFVVFCSCGTTTKIRNNGTVLTEYVGYYVNDSLEFSYMMPGDYNEFLDMKTIRKALKRSNINLKSKNCLGYFNTFGPYPEHFLFYYPHDREIKRTFISKLDFNTNGVLVDSINYLLWKRVALERNKGYIYIVAKSDSALFDLNLKNEYINFVFDSIVVGSSYRNIKLENPFDIAYGVFNNPDSVLNYLMPIKHLMSAESNYDKNAQNSLYEQALATYLSFISNRDVSMSTIPKNQISATLPLADEAMRQLLEACSDRQVVMFNENHHLPNNRMLIDLILDDLYEKGFRYFGLEAITEDSEMLNSRGFVVTETGFYTREPMMSNLIRKAIKIGYKVFGYDDFVGDREKSQAINIYNQTFAKDSLAKVLVLAGFGHIDKSSNSSYMAREFISMYGIEPFTIDQTYLFTDSWLAIASSSHTEKRLRYSADIAIANNIDYETFAEQNDFVSYEIALPTDIIKIINDDFKDYNYIVSIYKEKELAQNPRTIPVYNYLITKSVTKPINVELQKDDYILELKNVYNDLIYKCKL